MGQRILLIDDDRVIGVTCKRILAADGHEVQCCEDPQAGLKAALSGDFDLVLLDLKMPGVHGLEILREIKAAGVPSEVVIITGHAAVDSAVEAMKQGAADYLCKPFSPDQLKLVLGKIWERSAPGARKRSLAARIGGPPGLRGDHRRKPGDGARLFDHQARCAEPGDRLDHRRERHRQGDGGARPPPPQFPQRSAPAGLRLHSPGADAAGKRARSATSRDRSPGRSPRSRGCSRSPTKAPSFSTKWGTSAWRRRASCSACWKPRR